MNKLELIISTELGNILKVERFLENLFTSFEIDVADRAKITLPVIEAVNNSILYGNKLDSEKKIKITAIKEHDGLSVTVQDEGEGFNYWEIPDPTTPVNVVKVSGRGLYLMLTLSDELKFHKNGSEVIMTFNLKK